MTRRMNADNITRPETLLRAQDNPTSAAILLRKENYLTGTRSLHFWPIDGITTEELSRNVDEFLKEAFLINGYDFEQIIIEDITKVQSAPQSGQHKEILVRFSWYFPTSEIYHTTWTQTGHQRPASRLKFQNTCCQHTSC